MARRNHKETHLDLQACVRIVAEFRYANVGKVRNSFCTFRQHPDGHVKSIWKSQKLAALPELLESCGHQCTEAEVEALAKVAQERGAQINERIMWKEFLFLESLRR